MGLADDRALEEALSLEELHDYCEEIIWCLMRFGNMDEAEAKRRLDESGQCAPENNKTLGERATLMHEYPYFWAMEIVHGKRDPQWFNNRELALWPPPKEYFEEARRRALGSEGEKGTG